MGFILLLHALIVVAHFTQAMRSIRQFYGFLFEFDSYKRGLTIHLSALFLYSCIFLGIYFVITRTILPDNYKFYYQLILSKLLVVSILGHAALLIVLRWNAFAGLIKAYFTEPGAPYNLAIFRILFFIVLSGQFVFLNATVQVSWTYLPASSRVSLPFMGWLIHHLPINTVLYTTLSYLGGILSLMICLGLFTRYALLMLLPVAFYVLGIPMFFGKMSHDHIWLWVPMILCFSPVSDVLSLDAYFRKNKQNTPAHPHTKYMLPFKILWIQLAIMYTVAGFVKLWDCGLDWALSDSMVNQMQWEWVEHYDLVPWLRIDHYPLIARLGGLSVIYFEILYVLLILKPSGRIWALLGGFSLHKLAGYFMYIDFSSLRLCGLSYINWHKLLTFLGVQFKEPADIPSETDVNTAWHDLKSGITRYTFWLGTGLVAINFLCSAFKIHSFPFSSYPTYSAIVKNTIKIIRMDAYDPQGVLINVKEMGEKANFRWESFRPYEAKIEAVFAQQDSTALHEKMEEYWMMWRNNVKGLDAATRVDMYLESSSIVPEERHKVTRTEYIGTIYPSKPTH
jgi:hypothetical protein